MKGWKEYNFKEITTKIGSGSTPTGGKEAYYSAGITLVRSLNVYDFEFERVDDLYNENENDYASVEKIRGVMPLPSDI